MPQHMSRIVVSILFSTLATASFADPGGQTPIQQQAVKANQDWYNTDSQSGFGRHIAAEQQPNSGPTTSSSGVEFKSFGDFLQYLSKK